MVSTVSCPMPCTGVESIVGLMFFQSMKVHMNRIQWYEVRVCNFGMNNCALNTIRVHVRPDTPLNYTPWPHITVSYSYVLSSTGKTWVLRLTQPQYKASDRTRLAWCSATLFPSKGTEDKWHPENQSIPKLVLSTPKYSLRSTSIISNIQSSATFSLLHQ